MAAIAVAVLSARANASADEPVSFRRDIAPILIDNCLACHGPKKAEAGYRVDSFARAAQAGDSGAAGFAAGDADGSEALRRITSDDEFERMPFEGDPLPEEQVALLARWIAEGAKFDGGDDPQASLASIVPPPTHPPAPQAYSRPIPITALEFSADGSQLFVGGYHEISVWNATDGQLVRRIANVAERTYAIALSPDGQTLAVAGGMPGRLGEVRLFDAASGELKRVLATSSDVVLDVAFHPNGETLAAASADGSIRICETATGQEKLAISSHSDWVCAICYNADGSKLASASRDKTAKVFDAATGDLLVTYSGHGQSVRGVAFHPGGEEAYSCGADNAVHSWKIADAAKTADVVGAGGELFRLETGGEFCFVPSADKQTRQFRLADRGQVRTYGGHEDWVLVAAYHDATQRLATGSFDGQVRIYNTEDGTETLNFLAAPGWPGEAPTPKSQ